MFNLKLDPEKYSPTICKAISRCRYNQRHNLLNVLSRYVRRYKIEFEDPFVIDAYSWFNPGVYGITYNNPAPGTFARFLTDLAERQQEKEQRRFRRITCDKEAFSWQPLPLTYHGIFGDTYLTPYNRDNTLNNVVLVAGVVSFVTDSKLKKLRRAKKK